MSSYKELLLQQDSLEVQIKEARTRELADAIGRAQAVVAEFGLTEQDIFEVRKKSESIRLGAMVAPKYRNPATGETWTGHGKPPKWIAGTDRGNFLIAG